MKNDVIGRLLDQSKQKIIKLRLVTNTLKATVKYFKEIRPLRIFMNVRNLSIFSPVKN